MTEETIKIKKKVSSNAFAMLFSCCFAIFLIALFMLLVYKNMIDNTGLLIVLGIVFVVPLVFVIGMIATGVVLTVKEEVPDELKTHKRITVVIQLLIIIISIAISGFIVSKNLVSNGYESGDYSDYKCDICDKKADGGRFKAGNVEMYYCKEHYESSIRADEEYQKSNKDSNGDEDRDEFGNEDFNAFFDATYEVKKKLKSPSTAKFCESYEAEINRNGNTWSVEGWVDAQNSFGATLRNDFVVKITYKSKDTYIVEYCVVK